MTTLLFNIRVSIWLVSFLYGMLAPYFIGAMIVLIVSLVGYVVIL